MQRGCNVSRLLTVALPGQLQAEHVRRLALKHMRDAARRTASAYVPVAALLVLRLHLAQQRPQAAGAHCKAHQAQRSGLERQVEGQGGCR